MPTGAKVIGGRFIWAFYVPLVLLAAALFGIYWWQLWRLEPSHWCGAAVGAAKITFTNLDVAKACFALLPDLISAYRQNTLVLGITMAIVLVALLAAVLGLKIKFEGPGGLGGAIGAGDDDYVDRARRGPPVDGGGPSE